MLAAGATLGAQALENIQFNRLSEADGLSQGSIQAIAQDSQGFIWLGTQQGLNRYDGYEFVSYFHDPDDETSLGHDWIGALHIDATGILWVGTKAGGLNRLVAATGTFVRYRHDARDPQSLGPGEVRAIVSDPDGGVWVGTDRGGVSRLDVDSGNFRHFRHDADDAESLGSDTVKALHIDAAGYVWVGSDGGGLSRIDRVRERVTRVPLPGAEHRVRTIASDRQGMLWVGTNEQGLFLVHPTQGVLRHFVHEPEDATSLSSDSIRALFVDEDGHIWVGTDSHGLNRFSPGSDTFTRIRHQVANPRSLSSDHVASIVQDKGGVLWIGTVSGVNTWNPLTGAFSTFNRESIPLSNDTITAFAELHDGRILVGSSGGGIDAVDVETGRVQRFGTVDGVSALSDERVFALHVAESGDVWAGTRAGGLNHFDASLGTWSVYRHDPDDPGSLSFDGVTKLFESADGVLWVGTYLGGLNRFDPESRTFRKFRHDPGNPQSICSDRVMDLFEDRDKRLWIGTHGGGLCEMDRATGTFTWIRHDPEDPTSLSSDDAWRLLEDPAGNLWIGTWGHGLNLWRAADRQAGRRRFTRLSTGEGLSSPAVYGLQVDGRGRIWVSGNRGINRITADSLMIHHYTAVDGLQSNEFNFGAAHRSPNGRLFFGGMNGFNSFFPESIDINRHAPTVALTRLERNAEAVLPSALENEGVQLELRYTDRRVTFEYAALDFTDPTSNRYEHRLEGFDSGWVEDQGRRRVTYTNLPPGDYQLRVRATNNDGVWGANELQIPMTVLPAPWATWWAQSAYVIAALLAVLLAYLMYARRLARAEEMNRVQASLISEITERQIKEAELARTRNRAQRYLDVVEVIILALDQGGTVTLVNQKGVRVLGYAEDEIVGRNFYDCFVPEAHRAEVRERFENLDQYAYSESPIKPKEGGERMIAWHAIAAPPMQGEEASGGVLISGSDVTQMRNLERQLRDAQKMEALGTLARGVAHDFNNILTSILGYVQLSQTAEPSTVAQNLEKLETSVGRARDLVARILAFGRGGSQAPRPIRVEDAVSEALALLTPVVGSNIHIAASLDNRAGPVLADPTQLVQVVLNLCTNAAQAMKEEGGTLSVEVANHDVGIEEARNLAVLVPGPHVRLSVSDTGPGMDDFTLARIFDPFFTTRTRDEGTGLGLAVVHGIISQLRGTVQVFSAPGDGTRFDVYLPQTSRPVAAPEQQSEERRDLEGSETILFVDDEPGVRAVGEEALTKLGYRVLTAADGDEALEIFDARAEEIDAVITDQTMPSHLGHRLAQQIKERFGDVPVLLMSGADRPASDAVDGFVDKPFTLRALAEALRDVLAEKSA